MKILVLSKRFYTNRDLLGDRYGRLWELPYLLARSGHQVRGFALSYRAAKEQRIGGEEGVDIEWRSFNFGFPAGIGLMRYRRELKACVRDFRPDLIWASSDVFHVILGARLGSMLGIPVVADLYDNYESFAATRMFPGAVGLYRRSLAAVQGITCVSRPLARKIADEIPVGPKITVIENGVDERLFRPMDKHACRQRLGLPPEGSLVGVAGALSASRGIAVVGDACRQLQREGWPVRLVVAGPRDRDFRPPTSDEGFDLDVLAHREVPVFINAMDVVVIANIDAECGRYCFPMKLNETLACGVPLAAASVGAIAERFADQPHCLFRPDDAKELAKVIRLQLDGRARLEAPVSSWRNLAHTLDDFFSDVVVSSPMSMAE